MTLLITALIGIVSFVLECAATMYFVREALRDMYDNEDNV
jgi:hypothetical protein